MESLYSRRPNLILGFHGCDQSVADNILIKGEELRVSNNDYDWLGNGIYFWENNEERALMWAEEQQKRKKSVIGKPAVIGAVLDLGYCLDLTDNKYLKDLKDAYNTLESSLKKLGKELPTNDNIENNSDLLIRKLDCAVIQTAHQISKQAVGSSYDSVRGVFWEGKPLYKDAGFKEKNHIQICVCNPNCIKGYFRPRKMNVGFRNP